MKFCPCYRVNISGHRQIRGTERAGLKQDSMLEFQVNYSNRIKSMLDSSFGRAGLLGADLYDLCEPLMEPQVAWMAC